MNSPDTFPIFKNVPTFSKQIESLSLTLSCDYWGLWSEGVCNCGMTPIHTFTLSWDYWGLWSEGSCDCGMTSIHTFTLSCNYWGIWSGWLLGLISVSAIMCHHCRVSCLRLPSYIAFCYAQMLMREASSLTPAYFIMMRENKFTHFSGTHVQFAHQNIDGKEGKINLS